MATFGLFLFMAVVALDVAGLLLDIWLRATGRKTVSEFARAHPWAGMVIVLLQMVGAFGMVMHLYG